MTTNITITPRTSDRHDVTANGENVGYVYGDIEGWIAVNQMGDETSFFPTKWDAANYIANNGEA